MREALEEARQYTAIHEVKVSKGRRTLDIAKDDLPVYKAKGWKLAEEVDLKEFKNMIVTINDPRKRKKAIDDLVKKNFGIKKDVMNPSKFKVYGNDTDLNKYATDLKNFYGAQIKAEAVEELEEKFTIGDYKRLEADNQHDVAAKKLVDMFGTPEDKKEIDAINKRHNKTGYITGPDFKKRTQIVNKYFSKLMP